MDDLGNKIKDAARFTGELAQQAAKFTGDFMQQAAKKTSDIMETTKYGIKIKDEENDVKTQMTEMGRILYEKYADSGEFPEEFAECIELINISKENIAKYKTKIEELKTAAAETTDEDADKILDNDKASELKEKASDVLDKVKAEIKEAAYKIKRKINEEKDDIIGSAKEITDDIKEAGNEIKTDVKDFAEEIKDNDDEQ